MSIIPHLHYPLGADQDKPLTSTSSTYSSLKCSSDTGRISGSNVSVRLGLECSCRISEETSSKVTRSLQEHDDEKPHIHDKRILYLVPQRRHILPSKSYFTSHLTNEQSDRIILS